MVLLVLAFLASLLPSVGLFLWLRKIEGDPEFEGICNKALLQGAITVLPVVGCSALLALGGAGLTLLFGLGGIPKAAYHDFIVLALSEELCKCFMFHKLLEKYQRAWSWMDYIILMTLVGIGFGLAEDIPYAIGAGAIVMLIRGATCMHGGYGFIMGYFLGKAKKTGNKAWAVAGVVIPWLLHGFYDFGLSDEFAALGENTPYLSVSLAAFALVTIVILIIFFIRHRHDERYLTPTVPVPELATSPEPTAEPSEENADTESEPSSLIES